MSNFIAIASQNQRVVEKNAVAFHAKTFIMAKGAKDSYWKKICWKNKDGNKKVASVRNQIAWKITANAIIPKTGVQAYANV